ncbi:MAG TPA: penicillin-binding protein [Candidatus Paceibacterota bacterium]|nr:penicillin-binding protein [Candidatus Paceibacterota bacterium]
MLKNYLERIQNVFHPKRNRKPRKQWLIDLLVLLVSLGILFTGALIVWASTIKIPDFQNFDNTLISESTKIYDRTGTVLLYDAHGDIKRTIVPLDQISPNVQHATIALEDEGFYHHHGIDFTGILRALWADIKTRSFSQGGSTITQQVAKNTMLTNNKTIVRKIKEAVIAIKMDHEMTKNQILGIYLNVIPYGGNIYGIEEAAESYFGKHAADLDLAESAYLAALPQSPTYYSPYGNHRDALDARKNYALKRMLDLGYITQDQYTQAINEQVTFAPQDEHGIKAPHFVMYVLEQLEAKYGRDEIDRGGLKVITTLDYDLYEKAQKIVHDDALENEKVNNASNMGMVGIDPNTGQILLMIGSRDYFDKEIDGKFNVTTESNRQPGSAFKPFVYATAFEEGYTPSTVLFDVPTQFNTGCQPFQTTPGECGYTPQNYDNMFRGPITLRDALAQSVNVPSVKILYLAGVNRAIEQAQAMGITGLGDKSQYGLTLVLGGGEVSVLDMASAYGVFATGGIRHPYTSILKITDRDGKVLEQYQDQSSRVLDQQAALEISDILNDNVARTPLYGANSPLYFPGKDVAVKTGTTNNYKDAWTVGYSTSFSLAAWAGNNDNSPMAKKVSGYIITPTWRKVMDLALAKYPGGNFQKPDPTPTDLKPVLLGIWNPGNSADSTNPFATQDYSNVHSILYWVDKNDPRGPIPSDPSSDPQFRLWEPTVRAWAAQQSGQDSSASSSGNSEQGNFKVKINQPNDGDSFDPDETINVQMGGKDKNQLQKIDVYVNDFYVNSASEAPFEVSFQPSDLSNIQGENTLKVISHSKNDDISINSVKFEVNQ